MIEVKNVYPDYDDDNKRQEKVQDAYTYIQKMLYNNREGKAYPNIKRKEHLKDV